MSRKNYIQIAADIRKQMDQATADKEFVAVKTIEAIVQDLCCMFEMDNRNFHRRTFMDACGCGN